MAERDRVPLMAILALAAVLTASGVGIAVLLMGLWHSWGGRAAWNDRAPAILPQAEDSLWLMRGGGWDTSMPLLQTQARKELLEFRAHEDSLLASIGPAMQRMAEAGVSLHWSRDSEPGAWEGVEGAEGRQSAEGTQGPSAAGKAAAPGEAAFGEGVP